MTKKDIVAKVAENCGITKKDATEFVNMTFDTIVAGIENEGKVSIPGIGTFERKQVEERPGRNPQTGETLVIPAHGTIKFKASKSLKDAVR